MYIIEELIKIFYKLTKNNNYSVDYSERQDVELEDVITCNHNFMPIDSTGEIFACSKCGYVISKKRLNKNKNFFKNQ